MYEYVKNSEQGSRSKREGASGPALSIRIRTLDSRAPFSWLSDGFKDLRACGGRSLVYGVFFVLMGLGIERAHSGNPAVALGLSAAFLFAGPFLSMGIYELSRQLQAGERVDLLLSLFSWCRNPVAVGRFAFFLAAVLVLWLWLSYTLVDAIGQGAGPLFGLAALVWIVLAFLVLMASAMAIPMLLDVKLSATRAVHGSVRCFLANKGVLLLWFLLVALAVALSLLLNYWPLLVLGPWLGHATWHAYEQCVEIVA